MNDHPDVRRMLSDYLEQARSLARQDRFDEALACLRDAYKLPSITESDIAQIEAVEEDIEEGRLERVRFLTSELETLLHAKSAELTQADLDRGEEILAYLQNIHATPVDLEPLAERWQAHRRRAETLLDLELTRRKLDEFWQSSPLSLSRYDKALALARQKVLAYPNEPLALQLLEEAQARREDAYQKEGDITTLAAIGDFEALIKELRRWEAEGYEELPWYDWATREIDGKPQRGLVPRGNVPPHEAIERAIQLAAEYEDKKADEYIQRAQAELPANPGAAAKWIEDALAFKYISPRQRGALQTFYDGTIAPALEERRLANELLQEALRPGKDIEEAWALIDQVEIVDPYAPEVAKARDELRPRLKVHLEGRLRRAVEKRQIGDFETAEEMASVVCKIAKAGEGLQDITDQAQTLIRECDTDRALFKTLEAEAEEIKNLVDSDLAAATQALADLEARTAGRPERFQRLLRGARHAVQARQSPEKLLTAWDRRFRSLDPVRLETSKALRQALSELNRLDEEIDQARVEHGRLSELLDFQKRVRARRDFVQGRLDWEQGLYQRARTAWTRVAGPDDAMLAKEWLGKAEDATAVSQAIELAKLFWEDQDYQQALDKLRDWRTKASPKQQDVRDLYRQIEQEWTNHFRARKMSPSQGNVLISLTIIAFIVTIGSLLGGLIGDVEFLMWVGMAALATMILLLILTLVFVVRWSSNGQEAS